ncbi:unnamed protein product [Kuraishia capsulata CBS 1993]|uniref:Uncharacterized protein n=1 Tax=Kuraishia capsulata CBS 1993 TaxID=1382522 RepID=W6MST1_9ASCO|nr:uncharacterized protein KUCA_T00000802001 [Kuraishia capsulata CBS 1993]CDK24835.1 unnamed protein product [Kuraishia capsulata CBS 1993]
MTTRGHTGTQEAPQRQKITDRPISTLVKESFECERKILELDAQTIVADLNMMEAINTDAVLRYRAYEKQLNALSDSGSKIRQHNDIEVSVDKLQVLSEEIDEWSAELEVKARRYIKNYK